MERQHFQAAFNYHAFGNYVNIPFACRQKGKPEKVELQTYNDMAAEITLVNGFGYGQSWQDSSLYAVNGETSDWMWKEHQIFAMSPEVSHDMHSKRILAVTKTTHCNINVDWSECGSQQRGRILAISRRPARPYV